MKVEKGIYVNEHGVRLKVSGKKPNRGWGKDTVVMNYTNLPSYGKSEFGMKGEHLKRFLS